MIIAIAFSAVGRAGGAVALKSRRPSSAPHYLERAIGGLDPADRLEVLQEIRNHVAEAMAGGRSLDLVLASLGPADALGRAYAVALLLHPQNDRPRHAAERWFRLVGLIVFLSIPTIVAVSTLASVGISLVAAGLFAFVIGALDVGYMTAYDPTEEYALMAKAGMTFPQILASLTTVEYTIRDGKVIYRSRR